MINKTITNLYLNPFKANKPMTQTKKLSLEPSLKTKRLFMLSLSTILLLLACTGLVISFIASDVLLREFSMAMSFLLSLFLIRFISKN
jgi:membrane-bound ClpP family serine protease